MCPLIDDNQSKSILSELSGDRGVYVKISDYLLRKLLFVCLHIISAKKLLGIRRKSGRDYVAKLAAN